MEIGGAFAIPYREGGVGEAGNYNDSLNCALKESIQKWNRRRNGGARWRGQKKFGGQRGKKKGRRPGEVGINGEVKEQGLEGRKMTTVGNKRRRSSSFL